NSLRDSTFQGEGSGVGSKVHQAAKEFISAQFYGNTFKELGQWKWFNTGKKFSLSKAIHTVNSGVSAKNLMFNTVTSVVGGISASLQERVMTYERNFFTSQGDTRVMSYAGEFPKVVTDFGKKTPTSFLGKLLLFSGVRN